MSRFASWEAVLLYLATDAAGFPRRWIWYHAPLDRYPRLVRVVRTFKNGKVRLDPCSPDADAFTADAGHLDRMRRGKDEAICCWQGGCYLAVDDEGTCTVHGRAPR